MSKKLLKSGAIVSAMTLISRILGLIRDMVVANILGAGAAADVFLMANKIPNFLRRLFAEGAFAQAFVPVFSEYQQKEDETELRKLIAAVSGTLGTIVTVITLIGVLGSPVIIALFGFGWFVDWWQGGPDAEKYTLASTLLKITFPYLWFITFVAMSGAILNSLGKFAIAAFTPVFLNIAIISCALILAPHVAQPEYIMASGVFLGGLIQFLFQIPFLKQAGVLVKPKWQWHHPGVVKIRTLMIPAMFGVSVSQINLLLDTVIASFLQDGALSWLYFSDRLLEFPLGLFGIAIATVILPSLSRLHASDSKQDFAQTLDWGFRLVCLLGVPAMFGLILLAQPMLAVLFMSGKFSQVDVQMASMSLIAYGFGLLSFMLVKVLAPGYYARQDTKTPVKYGIIAMVSNMAFNIIFAIPYGYVGLAIATSLSASLNAFMLWRGLKNQGVFILQPGTVWFLIRLLLAAFAMGAFLVYFTPDLSTWAEQPKLSQVWLLAALISAGAVIYLAINLVFGLRPRDLRTAGG
ncbi:MULTISPECIES: murein biosynthesis integral membrane protein MurJ [unclassified Motilimonas]|uniref:murein biosynthesis integral membrane protein MurJ n=1 Tax=Motilimonas TaxID=1914248 RepID=UPI001E2AC6B2|nr:MULTISPECIES: murein biosynthesis integral membrane protein MurJ [unclassified Motilimonas]MCE0559073.1 murein biosynthesis integral membrane protein MurJ [Motilimonas sp. E26]MDO6527536.1 murein biosynthesis integral membrane protein MurJ [Motilimonas sp. 1_MG-2023]